MYAANVKNWLMDLATGAKAAQRIVQFADAEYDSSDWRVQARCFCRDDIARYGIAIHNLKDMAKSIDVSVNFRTFEPDDYLYEKYPGYYYIDMFGVRFYDYADKEGEA